MFVSGSVKYKDVDGLLSLVAPRPVIWVGSQPMPITQQMYRLRHGKELFRQHDELPPGNQLVEFLTP